MPKQSLPKQSPEEIEMQHPSPMLAVAMTMAMLCGLAMNAAADAKCLFEGQPIVGIVKKKIGVFQPDGKWLKDVDSSAIAADATVRDCNEELGIVKIMIEGKEQWVDRLALNIRPARAGDCVARAPSRPSDLTEPVTSGAGESCTPASGGK